MTDKLKNRAKQNDYSRQYGKKKLLSINETEKLKKKTKKKEYMKKFRKKMKKSLNDSMCKKQIVDNQTACTAGTKLPIKRPKYCPVLSRDQYLSLFDAMKYGQLHDQKWAAVNMKKFHESMIFKIWHCQVCHEAWPLSVNNKKVAQYICSRCVRDKNSMKKFSAENNMIPSPVP